MVSLIPLERLINMNPPQQLRGPYMLGYTSEDREAAVTAVVDGITTTYGASREYNVPESTLRGDIKALHNGAPPRRSLTLPIDVEEELAAMVRWHDASNLRLTRLGVRRMARSISDVIGVKWNTDNGMPSVRWCDGFRRRHNLGLFTSRGVGIGPSAAAVMSWYDEYQRLIVMNNYGPRDTYNMDETGFALLDDRGKVVGDNNRPRHDQTLRQTTRICREHVTLIACVNACGQHIPHTWIIKQSTLAPLAAAS